MARQATLELVGDASKLVKTLKDAGDQSESFGDKMKSTGTKMTAFATVPIVGFLGAAAKAAVEDADAQAHLAHQLENSVGASKQTVAAVEGYISSAMKASTFTDDELRPSFETLVRSTNDVEKANKLMSVAMDVAAAKGIPLEAATLAVTKASEGQFAAANKLVPGLVDLKDKTLDATTVTDKMAQLFAGSASAATETAAGKAQMMTRDMGELTESLGTALIPIITTVIDTIRPLIDRFTEMDGKTQRIIVIVGLAVAAIGPLIGIIGALGTAMTFLAANPIVLVIAAVAALAAGLFLAYQKSETFRNIVNAAFDAVKTGIQTFWGAVKPIFELWVWEFDVVKGAVERLWNFIRPILDAMESALRSVAGPLGSVLGAVGKVGGGIGGILGKIPGLAAGGSAAAGQAYVVGERGPELFVPGRSGTIVPNGGGGGTTIVVNMGVVGDPSQAARQIIGLLQKELGRSGSLGLN